MGIQTIMIFRLRQLCFALCGDFLCEFSLDQPTDISGSHGRRDILLH
jgi:hypothetical protein